MAIGLPNLSGAATAAVEAQAGRSFSQSWCKGLRAIRGLPGLHRRLVVHLGDAPQVSEDGIEVLPLAHFAELLAAGAL